MKYRLIIIICLLGICLGAAAGDELQTVDSLLHVYQRTPDSKKHTVAQQIIDRCMADETMADLDLRVNSAMPNDTIDFLVYLAAERFYYNNSYFSESLDYIERAISLANDNDISRHAMLLCDRGYCLYKQGQLSQAATAEEEAMTFCMNHGEQLQLARAYLYLAIVNYSIPQVDQAKRFMQKAIETDRKVGINNNTHNILGIACEIYSYAGDTDLAISYGEQAVEAARAIHFDKGVVNHLSQLSYAYNRQGDYQRGLETARKAVEAVEQMDIPDRNLLAISLEYVAYNLLDLKRHAEAEPVLLRALELEREVGNVRSVCYDYKALAEAAEPDNPQQAIYYLRQYIRMADSLHNVALAEALGAANAKLHNDELQQENRMQRHQTTYILIISTILALLLGGGLFALFYVDRLRKKKNQRLQKRQEDSERFFTNVTHEFRTPLTVIQGLSRQLQQPDSQQDAEQVTAAAHIIEQQGSRLLTFVNQLLDVAKMRTTAPTPQWQRGDIVPLLTMLTESLQQLAASRKVTLLYHACQEGQVVDHEPDYIQKIVINLLSNALKYTPEGGEVQMESRLEADRFILSVKDTGMGISQQDLEHIFEPFYRAKITNMKQGTGIGLALTRQLVEASQGTINVDSLPGSGSTFTVTLPQHHKGSKLLSTRSGLSLSDIQPEQLSATGRREVELVDSPVTDDDSRIRLLIVEDNPEVAYYIGRLLVPHYDVFYADDGIAGLEKACQLVPDLVITDVMMPQMDGITFCREMRQQELTNHIPIIIITARSQRDDRLRGLEAGASAYLVKPFNAEELLVRVQTLLERQRLLQAKFRREVMKIEDASFFEESSSEQQPDDENRKLEGKRSTTSDDELQDDSIMPAGQKLNDNSIIPVEQKLNDDSILPPEQNIPSSTFNLQHLEEIVSEHMGDNDFDVEHIALLMNISTSQLRRKIAALTGVSPARYILSLRVEKAKQLLALYPDLSIVEVAFRTGFADNSHFTKVFRRYTQMTPLQYAKTLSAAPTSTESQEQPF